MDVKSAHTSNRSILFPPKDDDECRNASNETAQTYYSSHTTRLLIQEDRMFLSFAIGLRQTQFSECLTKLRSDSDPLSYFYDKVRSPPGVYHEHVDEKLPDKKVGSHFSWENSNLPPSFINEIVKIVEDETIVRSNFKSVSDVYSWIEEYGRTSDTKWNLLDHLERGLCAGK
ncbi:hypothetical protein AVEN_174219-1 [Araneus ventricosus]|uniref:Uncharacterized protein n=1 Tax=Araneus ventricosus TaxID=182803 RepID=A0A4Y2IVE1_ARAVE|nr:hypothetical protein AVEN_174219-1 [Araneus ventricosus]